MSLIPGSFLFRYHFPVLPVEDLPRSKRPFLHMPKTAELPVPVSLDGVSSPLRVFAGWNSRGLAVSVEVRGRADWPLCNPDSPGASDGVQIWIDTRGTQGVHRATRYCHTFILLPIGDGEDGLKPVVEQLRVARAAEDAPEVELEHLWIESDCSQSGYRVTLWMPNGSLHGLDPASATRIGFHLYVRDRELGNQTFGVHESFPADADPSLWSILELVDENPDAASAET